MKWFLSFIVVLTVFLSAGCPMPYHYTRQPGINGKIIDIDSGQSVPNVKITLSSVNHQTQTECETLAIDCSNQDGTFSINPKQEWGIYLIPSDPPQRRLRVSFEKDGYLIMSQDFIFIAGSSSRDLGEIRLRPKKE